MDVSIVKDSVVVSNKTLQITGSKSESNRLLLLQALHRNFEIKNLSNSDDSVVMQKALETSHDVIDVHHAGTAMRFLTAYFSVSEGRTVILTGSDRMKQRPIKILVEALRTLGAEIQYTENEGYPPLKITGKKLKKTKVSLEANVSSQYISALILVATVLENGLEITLKGEITSVPYINMTLSLLQSVGISTTFKNNVIAVNTNRNETTKVVTVESDWSSASYWYSIIALSKIGTSVTLSSYKQNSLQGDAELLNIFKNFGVNTEFKKHQITLSKEKEPLISHLSLDLKNAPDIAQTIAVVCFALGISCKLTGLHTLKIKETDRLEALKNELTKFGAIIEVTNEELILNTSQQIIDNVEVTTYNDHRMAMAFAPLGLKTNLTIKDADVVSKSYPTFWEDLRSVGFNLK